MPILVEAISLIVRRDAIDEHITQGWSSFTSFAPNQTLCTDGELARVGFMAPDHLGVFIETLESHGLQFMSDGECVDMSVVDQREGLTTACDWLKFGQLPVEGGVVSACWLEGSPNVAGLSVAVPEGWDYIGSLSHESKFICSDKVNSELEFIRSDETVDVYRDRNSGEEMFVAKMRKSDVGPS
jgi:hypothetical protein